MWCIFFKKMADDRENKEELGAAYLQEMYEVNASPEDVSTANPV